MTPDARALCAAWARDGLTKNESRVIFALMAEIDIRHLGLSDTSFKRVVQDLRGQGLLELIGDGASEQYRLSQRIRDAFRVDVNDHGPAAVVQALPVHQQRQLNPPPAQPGQQPAPEHPFKRRPMNQQLWAKQAAQLAGFTQDDNTLEGLAARKFGRA